MKLFISSDIEGTAGIAAWDETDATKQGPGYERFRLAMTKEVAAACEGAQAAGANDILVKDAHHTGLNIEHAMLPRGVRLNRGWSGSPLCMMDGLDESFGAAALTGYHSPALGAGSPLSHTMSGNVDVLLINGVPASEFTISAYTAGMLGVPLVFLSGDAALCALAREMIPAITAVAVSTGGGNAVTGMHPAEACDAIRDGMRAALAGDVRRCTVDMPARFDVEVRYKNHHMAFNNAFFPAARQADARSVAFTAEDFMEVLRFFHFCLL